MDCIHRPNEQRFVSDLISVQQFYDRALAAVDKVIRPADPIQFLPTVATSSNDADEAEANHGRQVEAESQAVKSELQRRLGLLVDNPINPEEQNEQANNILVELEQLCDPSKLLLGMEPDPQEMFGTNEFSNDFAPELRTIQLLKDDLTKRKDHLSYRQATCSSFKYHRWNYDLRSLYTAPLDSVDRRCERVSYRAPDVLLTVLIMKAYNKPLIHQKARLGRLMKADACYLVRGQNSLVELRDQIQCQSDFAVNHDYSDCPRDVDPKHFSKVDHDYSDCPRDVDPKHFSKVDHDYSDCPRDVDPKHFSKVDHDYSDCPRDVDPKHFSKVDHDYSDCPRDVDPKHFSKVDHDYSDCPRDVDPKHFSKVDHDYSDCPRDVDPKHFSKVDHDYSDCPRDVDPKHFSKVDHDYSDCPRDVDPKHFSKVDHDYSDCPRDVDPKHFSKVDHDYSDCPRDVDPKHFSKVDHDYSDCPRDVDPKHFSKVDHDYSDCPRDVDPKHFSKVDHDYSDCPRDVDPKHFSKVDHDYSDCPRDVDPKHFSKVDHDYSDCPRDVDPKHFSKVDHPRIFSSGQFTIAATCQLDEGKLKNKLPAGQTFTVNDINEHYKGAMFFVDDTFYNDNRREERVLGHAVDSSTGQLQPSLIQYNECADLSRPIREYFAPRAGCSQRSDRPGPFHTADMSDTRFSDLVLRLGQPYLFLHQGTCEHLMVFTDLRLLDVDDNQNVADYPIQVYTPSRKRVVCMACSNCTAKLDSLYQPRWAVTNCERIPYERGFFCEQCFNSFFYDGQRAKIGQFTAVPFFDRSALA